MRAATRTMVYSNPVYSQYFADPFVLKVGEEYFAYGTAPPDSAHRQFPVLHSEDLVHWKYVGHALPGLRGGHSHWAPEVAQNGGKFYLYYSASTSNSDEHHRLRVAVADRPEGPFEDSGKELLPDAGFSIDAHPFRDPQTGQWYLFFATDYLEDEPHGTGLAVVPIADDMMTPLETKPRIVLRASCVWQIYERNREYKGKVWPSWHCIEGPFVLFHQGVYYCLYSGGAWHTENYGVGFATADHPLGPWTDDWAEHGPMVLRGMPGVVVGPGHNSAVIGPDDRTLFLVYHAWDANHTARRMCIDPVRWTPDGPRCDGPSVGVRELEL